MVGSAGSNAEPRPSARGSLVGRTQELARLDAFIDRIGTSGGSLVVRGEAGIGKSALLSAVAERAGDHGARVVTTAGTQSEAHLAFAGLHQLLLPFLDHRGELPEPQRRALDVAFGLADGAAPDLFMVGLATLGLVTESAAKTPLLVVVEDAHWLDRSSAQVLAFVARRLGMEVVVLLFAVRAGIASTFDDVDIPELQLDALSDDASRALLQRSGVVLSDELRQRILAQAEGNPLALIELPRAAAGLKLAAPWEPLPLTAKLEATFAARLNNLDASERTLMLLAAVDDLEVSELSRAAASLLERAVTPRGWDRLAVAGIGSLEAGRFRFRHPLMRSAVYRSASNEERRQAHRALATTLTGDPDRAVWHEAAATQGPDDRVAEALARTADRARSRGSLDSASAALRRAAALTADRSLKAQRLLGAADIAIEEGGVADSLALYREAVQLGLPAHEAARASFALESMSSAWSGAAAIPSFAEIAERLAADGEANAALAAIATVGMRAFLGPLDDGTRQRVSAIVAGLAVPLDSPRRLTALALVDPVHRGAEVIQQLERISPLDIVDARDLTALGEAASAVWCDSLALPLLKAGVAMHRVDGRLVWLAQTLTLQAWVDARRGAVRQAITAAAEAAEVAVETRQVRYALVANLAHAVAAAGMGDEDRAATLIAQAEGALVPMGAHPLLALVAFARGRTALAGNRPAEAFAELARIFTQADAAYQPFVRGWALADLTEAAVHGDGDLDVVRGYVREWKDIAMATRAPSLQVQLAYAEAMLDDDARTPERFALAARRAAGESPFHLARAQLSYGAWLRRQRRNIDARAPLRAAAQVFDGLGQHVYSDRALRELRATGERGRQRVPEAWTELSPQELQIAQLAADGLSNRQIGERLYLSHRTIGAHLYNLFPKLGITSRAQLRDALAASPDV